MLKRIKSLKEIKKGNFDDYIINTLKQTEALTEFLHSLNRWFVLVLPSTLRRGHIGENPIKGVTIPASGPKSIR